MRRDLWRLGTPLLALGVSFVVVLIIGAANSPKHKPPASPPATHGVGLTITAGVLSGSPSRSAGQRHASRSSRRSDTGKAAIPGTSTGSASPSPTRSSSTTSSSSSGPSPSPSPSVRMTMGALRGGGAVSVLNAATLRPAVTGSLSAGGSYHTRLPAGSYLVCLRPRGAWKAAVPGLRTLAGWFCTPRQVGQRPVTVRFLLVSSAASGAGS